MDQILSNISLLVQFPVVNLKIIIDGLMIGAIFALAAYGLALVWGVMNVKNLAQGDFVILGGYVAWYAHSHFGLPALLGVPLAFVVLAVIGGAFSGSAINRYFNRNPRSIWALALSGATIFVAGLYLTYPDSALGEAYVGTGQTMVQLGAFVLFILFICCGGIYGLVISRVIERDLFTSLLATFGIAIMLAQMMNLLFGSDTQSIQLPYQTLYFYDGLVDIPIAKLVGVLMAAVLAAGVITFMKYSRIGQAIRATAQDPRAARVLGIDTEKVYAFTFSLNAAICGAAGAIIVMVWLIQPFYGITYSIRSFVIVTAAGLGNLPGVIAAGLGIGVLEQYGAHIFGIGYQQAIAVLLLLLVLIVRLIQQRRVRQVLA